MDNKNIIIIGIILLILVVVVIFVVLASVDYERIDITPNGTSIEVPANQTGYDGNVGGGQNMALEQWNTGYIQ